MTQNSQIITRFAPSPTGRLHIGNIRTALYNWMFAKRSGGVFVLRLDDTDAERSTQAFADGIVEDLAWLGLQHDRLEKQSDRFGRYDEAAEKLRKAGLLYACYETPDEIERRRKRAMARGLPPIYDRAALKLTGEEKAAFDAEGRTPHWRFLLPNFERSPFETKRTDMVFEDIMRGPQTVDLASLSDPVLIRGDGTYLYTLPSVVDDIDMGISQVIRGADHITNTGAQITIFRALGASEPVFGHHNLLQDASGEGLSKRTGSLSIQSLRDEGYEAMAVSSLAALTGTSVAVEPCKDMETLQSKFDPDSITKSDARFALTELTAINEKLIHSSSYADVRGRLVDLGADLGEEFWIAIRENLTKLNDVVEWAAIVEGQFDPPSFDVDDVKFLESAKACLPDGPWTEDVWSKWTAALKDQTGRKGRALFMPLRRALTGKEAGPELAVLLPLIGREGTIRRLP